MPQSAQGSPSPQSESQLESQPQAWYETKEGALEKLGQLLLALGAWLTELGQRCLTAAGASAASGQASQTDARGAGEEPTEEPTLTMSAPPPAFVFTSGPHAGEPVSEADHPSLSRSWPHRTAGD